jgi:hypothetical protein
MYTSPHGITVPEGTDLVSEADSQFKEMADSIDLALQSMPENITAEFSQALTATKAYRDEAEAFANEYGKKKALIVTFGDSYADQSDTTRTWPYQISQLTGSDVKNYAVAGAGFNVSDKLFITQIDTALADNQLDPTAVGIVICAGGRNDIMEPDVASTRSSAFVDKARTSFPNARILMVPMLWDSVPSGGYERAKAAGISEGATKAGAEVIQWAWTWNIGNKTNFPTGDIHPNADGAKVIASYMVSAINGNYTGRHESFQKTQSGLILNVTAQAGSITFAWGGNISNLSADLNITIPDWAAGKNNDQTPQRWGLSMTNSGASSCFVGLLGTTFNLTKKNFSNTATGGTVGGAFTFPW